MGAVTTAGGTRKRGVGAWVLLATVILGGFAYWRAARTPNPASPTSREGASRRPAQPSWATHLVLITLDTLRFDALGFNGNPHVATPNLDRLAAAGRVFTHAHAHNALTLPSHANILSGRYPFEHGVRENAGFTLSTQTPTLATLLKAQGFATGAVVAAFPLDTRFGLHYGFDFYDDRYPDADRNMFRVAQRPGSEVVPIALRWWREHAGKRRFLWVHLFDPHAPYAPPPPLAAKYAKNLYLGEIAAADGFLGELLDLVRSEADPTLIVFVADHGEGLGDHGEQTHGIFGYETTIKVPLVLWGPGVEPGVDGRLARHIDLLPTMLQAVGVAIPAGLSGRSLLAPPSEEPIASYFEALSGNLDRGWAPLRGIIRGHHKFIDLPLPELYDLATDPNETRNLVQEERQLARELRDLLPVESEWPPRRGTIPPEIEANLRSLGYITDSAPLKDRYGPDDDPKRLIGLDVKLHLVSQLYDEGRHDESRREAESLIALRPEMPQGYTFLAQSLLALGRIRDAVSVMEQALAQGHASDELRRQLGLTLSWVGRVQEALAVLQPLAERKDPAALSALGQVLVDAERPLEARAVLERALQIDPTDSSVYERLSVVALQLEEWSKAQQYAEQALDLDARLPHAWNNLGVAKFYLGDQRAALTAWQKSVELDPDQFDTLYNLGLKGAELGEHEVARQALRAFIARAPRERYAADLPQAKALLERLGG